NLVRGADRLAATLTARRDEALLYKKLATLRTDAPIAESLDELEYVGARPELEEFCERIGFTEFLGRVTRWACGTAVGRDVPSECRRGGGEQTTPGSRAPWGSSAISQADTTFPARLPRVLVEDEARVNVIGFDDGPFARTHRRSVLLV